MTKDEALKLALEALEAIHTHADVACVVTPDGAVYLQPAITAIKEASAQPAQEHDPWRMAQPKEHYALQVAAGSQAFYGFPNGLVSAPNAGGKCVTAGETAPTKLEST